MSEMSCRSLVKTVIVKLISVCTLIIYYLSTQVTLIYIILIEAGRFSVSYLLCLKLFSEQTMCGLRYRLKIRSSARLVSMLMLQFPTLKSGYAQTE